MTQYCKGICTRYHHHKRDYSKFKYCVKCEWSTNENKDGRCICCVALLRGRSREAKSYAERMKVKNEGKFVTCFRS